MKTSILLKFNRQFWLKCHLYLGLIFGLVIALIAFSGSLCLYQESIDDLLNPQLRVSAQNRDYLSLDLIMRAITKAHPQRHGEWTLELPLRDDQALVAWFAKPEESVFEDFAPLMVAVDPYSGSIIESRFWGQTFASLLVDFHRELLAGVSGSKVVGTMGLITCFSVISGLYLWWPRTQERDKFWNLNLSNLKDLCANSHRWLGLCFSPLLLLLALTGIALSFPDSSAWLLNSEGFSHGHTGPSLESTAQPNDRPTTLEDSLFIARSAFPKAKLRRITVPAAENGVYQLNFHQAGEPNTKHPASTVWLDRWSGQIRAVQNPRQFDRGKTVSSWLWPLHTGEAVGTKGRILWFMAGQTLFWLYISGLMNFLLRKGIIRNRLIRYRVILLALISIQNKSLTRCQILLIQLNNAYLRHSPAIKYTAYRRFVRQVSDYLQVVILKLNKQLRRR